MHDIQRQSHDLQKEFGLNATHLKVQIEGFVLGEVKELFVDIFGWNDFKACYINHYFVNQESVRWEDGSLYQRKQHYDLLTVNQAPQLAKRSLQASIQDESCTQNDSCHQLHVISHFSISFCLFFRTELRRQNDFFDHRRLESLTFVVCVIIELQLY